MVNSMNRSIHIFVSMASALIMLLSVSQPAYSAAASQKLTPIVTILLLGGEPLEVESHIPLSNAVNIGRNVQIQIIFNSKLDATSIDSVSVTLSNGSNISSTLAVVDEALTITPDTVLTLNTAYTVTLQKTLKNLAGDMLKDAYSWQFTTTAFNSVPGANNVQITDNNGNNPELGDTLTGSYTYLDVDGDSESGSVYHWTRNGSQILGMSGSQYTLVPVDNGAQIRFQVEPMASTGANPGLTAESPPLQVVSLPAPVAVADSSTTDEDTAVSFSASGNDTDGDNNINPTSIDLNMSIDGIQANFVDASGNQWAATDAGMIDFSPALNINGVQGTPYTIHDFDGLESNQATLSVMVNAVNDAPVAVLDSASTAENTPVQFSITGNDTDVDGNLDVSSVDLDPLLAGKQSSVVDAFGNSWSVSVSGMLSFSPAPNYFGTTSQSYTIEDSDNAVSASVDISITILDPVSVINIVYRSCAHALQEGQSVSGIYRIQADANGALPARSVYCDQTTDGGGWTLVGSTKNSTLNDEASTYYTDLSRLAPNAAHTGIWDGLRSLGDRWDVRFTCRATVAPENDPMDVDLSFYDINWYKEFTTGADADSCFSENNGQGADSPVPARRDNLNQSFRRKTDRYDANGYLEGEDTCGDAGDFTVDFDDRGMDGDQGDGTEWGEDDGARKCATSGLAGGQWFVYTRERPRVAVIGLGSSVTNIIRDAGMLAEPLSFNNTLANKITTENFDTIVIGRYATTLDRLDQATREALAIFGRNGGNVVTEWDGASIFMRRYAPGYRYTATAPARLNWFDAKISGGYSVGSDTPLTVTAPADPIFAGVSSPIQAGGSTEFFFGLEDLDPPGLLLGHEVLATFPGGITNFPNATYPAITRGRYCGGQFISANFDWNDSPGDPGFGPLIPNMVNNASLPSPADINEACPVQQRIHYGVCGNSQRDPANIGLTGLRQDTCVPSDAMQAMLITRNGTITNYSALQTYVRNGGIVVTEYDNAHTVYNGVFGGSVAQGGSRLGSCRDNVMPLVQQSPENGFWQENLFEPPASNQTGCGYDISALPGITKLGGWTSDTTQIGYRDLGEGRVWLVSADWQDGNNTFSGQSTGLMRYMVTHSAGGLYGRGLIRSGVWQNTSLDNYLDGNFTPCLITDYASSVSLADIQDACSGDTLVLACRPSGSSSLQVAAMGDRDEVLLDVGTGNGATNPHNGVNWYYSPSKSWGFAPGGQSVNRSSCDTSSAGNNDRLCWHTSATDITSGYRCGNSGNINGSTAWERIILQRDGDVPAP